MSLPFHLHLIRLCTAVALDPRHPVCGTGAEKGLFSSFSDYPRGSGERARRGQKDRT